VDHELRRLADAQQNYIAFVQTPFSVISQLEGKSNPPGRSHTATKVSTNYKLAGISDNKTLKKMNVGGAWRWESKKAIGYYGVADSAGIYQTPRYEPADQLQGAELFRCVRGLQDLALEQQGQGLVPVQCAQHPGKRPSASRSRPTRTACQTRIASSTRDSSS